MPSTHLSATTFRSQSGPGVVDLLRCLNQLRGATPVPETHHTAGACDGDTTTIASAHHPIKKEVRTPDTSSGTPHL